MTRRSNALQRTFAPPPPSGGLFILQKDSPSGLPEQADSLLIPVRFR